MPAAAFTPTPTHTPTLVLQEKESIKQLIAQLKTNDEDVCKAASIQLSALGETLGEKDVLEIVQVMKTGSAKWQRFLRRGPHCTYYEYTTTNTMQLTHYSICGLFMLAMK